jgi:hypothetical protein
MLIWYRFEQLQTWSSGLRRRVAMCLDTDVIEGTVVFVQGEYGVLLLLWLLFINIVVIIIWYQYYFYF